MQSWTRAGLIVCATFVVGCAGTEPDRKTTGQGPPGELIGKYSARLPKLNMPKGAECSRPRPDCLPPPATWVLEITADQLVLTPKGGEYPDSPIQKVSDPNATSGTLILGRSALPCIVTTGRPGRGVYSWTIEGDRLRLTAQRDNCVERKLVLTTAEWDRQQ